MRNKIVSLALQGGGSHGAFTWGVLERLLEEPCIDIEGISGASAGAMNAVVLAHGFSRAGRAGARAALAAFWERIAIKEAFSFLQPEMASDGSQVLNQSTPLAMQALLAMTRFFSPTQLNPFNFNPLRDILQEQIDFEHLRRTGSIKLFIAATKVSSGTLKIFRNHDLTLDALLASACLPSMHRPVEIDGTAYWDGGLTANPPILPLLQGCAARDVVVVLLHPCHRSNTPVSSIDIAQRLSEISFSSAFFAELGSVALAKREAERGIFAFGSLERRLKRLNVHMVEANGLMNQLDVMSKLNTKTAFIHALHAQGRGAAEQWLERHFHTLGRTSSCDLGAYLQ